jgi:hypothetical protein
MFTFIIVVITACTLRAVTAEQPLNPEYHIVNPPFKLKDDFGVEFDTKRYFPENTNERFGQIEFGYSATLNMSVPLVYRGLDLAFLQKCETGGRGFKEIAACMEKIDLNKDDMVDERELDEAKKKLTWFESVASFILQETSAKTIAKCTRNELEPATAWSHRHQKISIIGLLEGQKYCRDANLPLSRADRAHLIKECDRNGDGELSITKDYVETLSPCANFPFKYVSSIPDSCLCRCEAISMILSKICDRY